jgi:hypothetical protein
MRVFLWAWGPVFWRGLRTLAGIAFCLAVVIGVGSVLFGSSFNLSYVKEHAAARWREVGYEVIGYEGYQWGFWGPGGYGGAKVWYSLRRTKPDDRGVIYTGSLYRWGSELHVYGPRAIDAISTNDEAQ